MGGSSQSAMWENGFIQARLIRCRILHAFLCRLVGEVLPPALPLKSQDLIRSSVVTPSLRCTCQSAKYAGLAGSQEGVRNVLTPVTSKLRAKRKADREVQDGAQTLVPGATGQGSKPYTFAGDDPADSEKVHYFSS